MIDSINFGKIKVTIEKQKHISQIVIWSQGSKKIKFNVSFLLIQISWHHTSLDRTNLYMHFT